MRTFTSLALLLTVLTVCHAKNLLVETEDEDREPMIYVDPMPLVEPSAFAGLFSGEDGDITLEDLDDTEPKRRKNNGGNKSNKRLAFEMHQKAFRG